MLPFLALSYTTALVAWNVFQFLLLPIIGLLLYKALKNVNLVVIVVLLWIVLLQPLPVPPNYVFEVYHLYHSSYFYQWAEGQAKVFETFLIVAAYYLSKSRRPYLGGLAYGLAFFDPRFSLCALPLILMVNTAQYRRFSAAAVGTLIAGDIILLYDGLAASFLKEALGTAMQQLVVSSWIPLYTIGALTAIEAVALLHKTWLQRTKTTAVMSAAPARGAAPV